jgi:GAF domain-containing protein
MGDELVLGPCQGPVACARIGLGKGVCGAAWKEQRTIIVPDVDRFPGHIACSALSRSEIVVPLRGRSGTIAAVLDIDSTELDAFRAVDADGLGRWWA